MWRILKNILPAADRSKRGKRRLRWILRLIIIACAGALLLAAARPTYRTFKKWRSRNLAVRAETSLANNDLTNAARQAQAAYLMRPNEPTALRAAAKVQTSIGHPNAIEFWQA